MSVLAVKNAVGKDGDVDVDIREQGKRDSNEQVCVMTYCIFRMCLMPSYVRNVHTTQMFGARNAIVYPEEE